ncbi:MAG TPA: hypothetical protein VGD56_05475, partial [Gemmatirosa sp.]
MLDRGGQTKGQFTHPDFSYDAPADAYVCPGGERLGRVATIPATQVQPGTRVPGAPGALWPVRSPGAVHERSAPAAQRARARVAARDAVRRDTLA